MKVFDFDNTLYHGESAVDLAMYMIRHNRRIIRWVPYIFWNLLKYKLCLISKSAMTRKVERFMQSCMPTREALYAHVRDFWKHNRHKLDADMIRRVRPEDAIISAGPDFLLRPIHKRLGTSHLICSEVDIERKKVIYLNFRDHKVRRYREKFGDTVLEAFYTDSYNDRAMMDIAERVYLVKKGQIRRIR